MAKRATQLSKKSWAGNMTLRISAFMEMLGWPPDNEDQYLYRDVGWTC